LIYKVDVDEKKKLVNILMTFTTPFCPMADMIKEMIKNAVLEVVPKYVVELEVTFEPAWNQTMIKDPDLQKMFQ
jgi:metal-sulfur cluster biosynthetic enzyme